MRKLLVGDIGGTNARLALFDNGTLSAIRVYRVAEHAGVSSLIRLYLGQEAIEVGALGGAALGVAGPVQEGRCTITNTGWVADCQDIKVNCKFPEVVLLNDFEALAYALPFLTSSDLVRILPGTLKDRAPMLVVGPGTGFGAACLLPADNRKWMAIPSEAGHSTVPACNEDEDLILARLRSRFSHVSIEHVCSGQGLENLFSVLQSIHGMPAQTRSTAEIIESALSKTCDVSSLALETFFRILGTAVGNLALTYRAQGGVFLGGGIVPRVGNELAQSQFAERFLNKGRFRPFLEAIPVAIITARYATLSGLGHYSFAR